MNKVIGFLLKYVVPVLALAALLFAAVEYGRADGRQSRQQEVEDARVAKERAVTELAVANGKIEAYTSVGGTVTLLRDELTAQAEGQQKQLLAKLNSLGLIMSKVRTGDECVDARAVAVEYFEQQKAAFSQGASK